MVARELLTTWGSFTARWIGEGSMSRAFAHKVAAGSFVALAALILQARPTFAQG